MKTILAMLFATATLCATAQDTMVVKMEYYIDADPGVNNATSINIPAAANVTFPFTVDLTEYSIGYHKLYIRTRDNLGRWSLTARRNIEVLPAAVQNNVVSGEYFIDVDPGYGGASPIDVSTPGITVLQDFNAVLTGLSEGYHKLYGRFTDTYGNWSQAFRRNIEVIKDGDNKVINGEYFFSADNGFGDCTPVVFATPSPNGAFSFNIPAAQIPAGADTIYLRVRDDIQSRWSLTSVVDINAELPLTLLSFTATKRLNIAELSWQTTNEVNTAYFDIQRSRDALHFNTMGKVIANNRNGINDYHYTDDLDGLSSGKIFYRLQQTDIDGRSSFSKIVLVTIDRALTTINIYPNPANNYVTVIAASPAELSGAVLIISDITGRIMIRQQLVNAEKQQVNIIRLAKGIYHILIKKAYGTETIKLIVE